MERNELIRKFDKQASFYERRRKQKSQGTWRKQLLSSARGKVLEVAVGAGANFPFYPPQVEITAVDFSPKMLEKSVAAAREYGLNVQFLRSDVERLNFDPDSFDTIVSTLSLCGYESPKLVLDRFNYWCKSDGQILLLEHGISSFRPLSWLQHRLNPLNRKWVGCHLNRDILGMVQSRLRVEKYETHWLDMISLVWAKPKKEKEDHSLYG